MTQRLPLAWQAIENRTIGNAKPESLDDNAAMKPQTENRYLERVDRAVRLLAERLDDPPTADELARAVGLSRFHFQRIYRAATGETVLDTLRRLRASRAIESLAAGESVTDVAGTVGYETPQAFSRAFRQWTGMAPNEVNGRPDELLGRFRRPMRPDPKPLAIEITSLQPVRLTVVRTRRPFGPLNDVYEALFDAIERQHRLASVQGIYGLPENDPGSDPDGVDEHVAAVSLAGEPLDGFESIDLEARPALRLRHVGPFEDIDAASLALYRYAVDRDLALADMPALHHHLDEPEDVPAERLRTDLYLALAEAPQVSRA
jgi:AraC family transcriptional regulator